MNEGKHRASISVNNQKKWEQNYIYSLKQVNSWNYSYSGQYFWDFDRYIYIPLYAFSSNFSEKTACIFFTENKTKILCIIQSTSMRKINSLSENVHLFRKANFYAKAVSEESFQPTMIIHTINILFISTSTWEQNGYFFVLKLANVSYCKTTGSPFSALEN